MSWHLSLAMIEELEAPCVNSHSSQALAEDFSARGCLDGDQCAELRSIRIAERSCFGAKKKASYRRSLSGMTYAHSTAELGVTKWMSSRAASHVSPTRPRDYNAEPTTHGTFGPKQSEPFARWDRDTWSWKTWQLSLITGTSEPFLGSFRKAGIACGGRLYRLPSLEHPIGEIVSGLLPTPNGMSTNSHVSGRIDEWGGRANRFRGSKVGRLHLPDFEAWMMGWPEGWQKLTPLDRDKYQRWLEQHGNY